MNVSLKTPVALLFFNRPDPLAKVFAQVRLARPETLLLVADGPRPGRAGEADACARARAVALAVDWPCKVLTNFSEVNLGCRRRVSSGLDWVFSQVEEAIILEDDCLPDPSFFAFCEQMLERYRTDERVMVVSGRHYFDSSMEPEASYYFTRYPHIWGWASWARAWRHYDVALKNWPQWRASKALRHRFTHRLERMYWARKMDLCFRELFDTWDYQWSMTVWMQNGLAVIPATNMIENIGAGPDATHTLSISAHATRKAEALAFPLRHPQTMLPDLVVERLSWRHNFRPRLSEVLGRRLRQWWGRQRAGA
jgi:hypothetical protein